MKSAIVLAAAISCSGLADAGAQAPAGSSAPEIERLDSLWANAYAIHDTAFAEQLLAPDLLVTSGQGSRKTREQELGDIRAAPGLTVRYFRSTNRTVRLHGATAVVAGRLEWQMVMQGRETSHARSYTATYARGGPLGWQMVALHIGPVP